LYLFLVALLLSPLYLWKSGLPQASHFVAAAAIGYRYTFLKPKQVYFETSWIAQLLFLVYSFLVAAIVYVTHTDINTLIAPLYYIFGFLVFVEIVTIYSEKGKKFLTYTLWLHIIILVAVIILSIFGIGRSYISESAGLRMTFGFNNPNQMANWVIWFVVIISTTGRAVYRSWLPGIIGLLIGAVLVYFTMSRSGFVGIAVIVAFYLALGLRNYISWYINHQNRRMKRWIFLVTTIIICLMAIVIVVMVVNYMNNATTGVAGLDKIINRVINTDFNRQIQLRGYDRLWKYPEYLLFGAGEGARERFAEKTSHVFYEIHSSWAGLLFNYGLVGFALFSGFLLSLLKKIKLTWFKFILLAPFFFGLTNYNIRNWYFWIGLALVYSSALLVQENEDGEPKSEMIVLGVLAKNFLDKVGRIPDRLFKRETSS